MKFTAAVSAICLASASAFAPLPASRTPTTLRSSYDPNDPNANPEKSFGFDNASGDVTKESRQAMLGVDKGNQNPLGGGSSLQYGGADDDAGANYGRLRDKLNEADVERRKIEEAAEIRDRAAEIAREERLAKIAYMKDMPDSQPAGTVDEFMFKEGVQDRLDKLDRDLVGLVPVKKRVKEIAALLVLDKMGYSRQCHVVLATRDDLVGQYVGHTAPKTKEMIKKAMGGVLLIDEAYYLYNAANDRDYGQESIEILLNIMENNKDDLVVAVAGYKDRMDRFFSYIPGMMSRIGNHVDFPNYSADELVKIAEVMARDLEYDIDDNAYPVFKQYIEERMKLPYFSNARTVRNAMDRARMNAAIRTFERFAIAGENGGQCTEADLRNISADDFQVLLDDILNADKEKRIFA